jgi:flavodoxin I
MIGLFFGSTNGNTAAVAEQIRLEFADQAGIEVELFDIADYYLEEMADFDTLILGIPTWNIGQLQRDWEAIIDEFDNVDLHGKRAALFGLGDQVGYPETFGDAVFFLADKLESQGAQLVGSWPTDGYNFSGSWALRDGRFLGLMLDEDNQSALSPERICAWVRQLIDEFGLANHDDGIASTQ